MIDREELIEKLNWRYAVKVFDKTKKITEADWKTLENSLRLAPSSFGLQPWKFLVIQNPELRAELREVTWGQSQVTDCSHYVVFAAKKTMDLPYIEKYLNRISTVRGVSKESLDGYKARIIENLVDGPRASTVQYWAQRQAYIAMGFLMESAALLNIDTCPIEGLEPARYDEILNLKDYAVVASCAVGYRHTSDKYQNVKKVRFETSDIFDYR